MLTMLLSMLSDENDRKALSELYKQYQGKTGRDSHRNVERLWHGLGGDLGELHSTDRQVVCTGHVRNGQRRQAGGRIGNSKQLIICKNLESLGY